jgi:hypothetical protein
MSHQIEHCENQGTHMSAKDSVALWANVVDTYSGCQDSASRASCSHVLLRLLLCAARSRKAVLLRIAAATQSHDLHVVYKIRDRCEHLSHTDAQYKSTIEPTCLKESRVREVPLADKQHVDRILGSGWWTACFGLFRLLLANRI